MDITSLKPIETVNGNYEDAQRSYLHGCSTVPLLFDTVGQRLRLAAKKVCQGSKLSELCVLREQRH